MFLFSVILPLSHIFSPPWIVFTLWFPLLRALVIGGGFEELKIIL